MAGDWIKMRINLWTHPKVVRISSALDRTRVHTIGALHGVWSIADQHADENGLVEMPPEALDAMVETPGFCEQLAKVGWIDIEGESLQFVDYQEHNGTTAKTRAKDQKRKKASRSRPESVRNDTDKKRTREEERREEVNTTNNSGRKRFKKPTVEEVREYCNERGNNIDPQHFWDYYEANGWKTGRNPMKDWNAAVRTWEQYEKRIRGRASPTKGFDQNRELAEFVARGNDGSE